MRKSLSRVLAVISALLLISVLSATTLAANGNRTYYGLQRVSSGDASGDAGPVKPDTPVSPTDKPVSPSDKPVSPSDKPVSPSDKPVSPSDKPVSPSDGPDQPTVKTGIVRLGGADRFETANKISAEGWEKAETVIITNAYNYADALAGAPLAYAIDAPILLASGEQITPGLEAELGRLNAKKVIILGGDKAVSRSLEYSIQIHGYTIERIAGETRYETAVKIAEALQKINGTLSEAFIASGENYPDALSASSAAAIKNAPILYSPKNGSMDDNTLAFINSCGIKSAYILGGEAAVGKTAETGLNDKGVTTVKRLGGTDRYETAIIISENFKSLFDGKAVSMATGKNFPDALAGSVLAAKLKMPVLLTDNEKVNDRTKEYIANSGASALYVFGANAVISDSIASAYGSACASK